MLRYYINISVLQKKLANTQMSNNNVLPQLADQGIVQNPENVTPTSPENLTPALPEAWKPIEEWAKRNRVSEPLKHVINAALILHHPEYFGTILDLLTDEYALLILSDWADIEALDQIQQALTPAQNLYCLAKAAISDSSVRNHLPSTKTVMPASKYLKGRLKSKYLLGMLYQYVHDFGLDDRIWMTKLKLWVFTHAIDREFTGNIQDRHLRVVSDNIRLACHKQRDKRKMLFALKSVRAD